MQVPAALKILKQLSTSTSSGLRIRKRELERSTAVCKKPRSPTLACAQRQPYACAMAFRYYVAIHKSAAHSSLQTAQCSCSKCDQGARAVLRPSINKLQHSCLKNL